MCSYFSERWPFIPSLIPLLDLLFFLFLIIRFSDGVTVLILLRLLFSSRISSSSAWFECLLIIGQVLCLIVIVLAERSSLVHAYVISEHQAVLALLVILVMMRCQVLLRVGADACFGCTLLEYASALFGISSVLLSLQHLRIPVVHEAFKHLFDVVDGPLNLPLNDFDSHCFKL